MDSAGIKAKFQLIFEKYKYVCVVIVIGVILMLLPPLGQGREVQTTDEVTASEEILVNTELANILSRIQGVGRVEVMLTISTGEERIYQVDEDISDNGGNIRRSTVIVSDGSRNELGLLRQIKPATYLGALVVCEGGADPGVRLSVVEAVSKLTGLSTDRICVVKMK